MILLWQFVALLGVHWVADFVLQTHWQASNKSKDNVALSRHVLVYTGVLGVATLALSGPGLPWMAFVLVNGTLHFGTDYCTSRATSKLFAKQDWHNFFVVVGIDQLIHQITLAATMIWILR